jgi:lysophospholipase L1-like esterase
MNKVLIIGDSISLGYTPEVARLLAERVAVAHNPGNAQYSAWGLRYLREWLGDTRWDLIHLNWGIWDLHHLDPAADPLEPSVDALRADGVRRTTPAQYAANLEAICDILQTTGARLAWATITPLPAGDDLCVRQGEEVQYNAVARAVMDAHGIPINDLYACALPELARIQPPRDVHFTEEGYRFLGARVAAVITEQLGR